MYDFTETAVNSVHVTFTLPSFLQDTGDVTTFNVITDTLGQPITDIQLIGGGADSCVDGLINASAPCWLVKFAGGIAAASLSGGGAAFNGLGTFTNANGSEILKITDVSSVPEPGSLVLLSTVIAAAGLALGKKRLSRHTPALEP